MPLECAEAEERGPRIQEEQRRVRICGRITRARMSRGRRRVNTLYYGDNLDILVRYIKDETVDLVYLDPPFKSSQDYNVLFAEQNGTRSSAQIKAFEDTWRWDQEAAEAYERVVEAGGRVSQVMQAFRTFLGESDMMASRGVAPGTEAHRIHVFALRPDRQSLPQDADGRGFRSGELQKRDHLEAKPCAQRSQTIWPQPRHYSLLREIGDRDLESSLSGL